MKSKVVHDDVVNFLKNRKDESIDLIVTSPPYNIGKEYENRTTIVKY